MEHKNEATLHESEYHPAADIAMRYVIKRRNDVHGWSVTTEAIASTAMSGNRLAEICLSTIRRLEAGEPVSDRYLMGLAWMLYSLDTAEAE